MRYENSEAVRSSRRREGSRGKRTMSLAMPFEHRPLVSACWESIHKHEGRHIQTRTACSEDDC